MDLQLINQLFTNLNTLYSLVVKTNTYKNYGYSEIESYNNATKKNIYSIDHNGIEINIIKSNDYINSKYYIQFKEPQQDKLINMEFLPLSYEQQYIYQQTFINNSPAANEDYIERILKNIAFDSLLGKEIKDTQSKIEVFNNTENDLEKKSVGYLLDKISRGKNDSGNSEDIEKMIYDITKKAENTPYFKEVEKNNLPTYTQESANNSDFENYEVHHTYITKHVNERSSQHIINFKDKNTDVEFSLQFTIKFPYSYIDNNYTVTTQVIFEDRFINDKSLINEIIKQSDIQTYLETTLEKIELLRNKCYGIEFTEKNQPQSLFNNVSNNIKEMKTKFSTRDGIENKYKK